MCAYGVPQLQYWHLGEQMHVSTTYNHPQNVKPPSLLVYSSSSPAHILFIAAPTAVPLHNITPCSQLEKVYTPSQHEMFVPTVASFVDHEAPEA